MPSRHVPKVLSSAYPGGIDSAVVSTLAAQTSLSVLLLEIPIRQKSDQVSRAQEHMGRLKQRYPNVKAQSVDLTQTFDTFADTVDVSETEFPTNSWHLPMHAAACA